MRRRTYSWGRGASSFGSFTFSAAASLSSCSSTYSPSSSSFFFMSSFSAAAIVVAFDVAVLSNALESFATKGGGKNSFDLFICMPFSGGTAEQLAEGTLERILNGILEYRAVLHTNCSEIQPPLATDYSQILYLMIPDNKRVIENSIVQISQFYHMIKRTFQESSTPPTVGKLLWMPLFLVVWPDLEDYCGNDTTTEKLIRASFHQSLRRPSLNNNNDKDNIINKENKKRGSGFTDNKKESNEEEEEGDDKGVLPLSPGESFSVNSDVYFYFGKECEEKRDNVWEVYTLHPVTVTAGGRQTSTEIIVQKLTPDRIPYESMFEGVLGRVRRRKDLRATIIRAVAARDPSSFLKDPKPGAFNPLSIFNGTPHVVFNEMTQGLNFTPDVIAGDWIRKHPNGTLKGTTANLLRRGLADMTISLTSLLPYRKVELSFLQPTYSDSVNGFFVQPSASSFRDIVIAPFSFGLWLSLLITYLIIVASILCFATLYRKMNDYYSKGDEEQEESLLFTLHSSSRSPQRRNKRSSDSTFQNELVLWAVGAMTQQGWYISPHSNSIRMAFLMGHILGLVCYGAFSAAVTSILAVELVPIKTRSDLLNSSLTFYADDASSTMAYIVNYLEDRTQVLFGNPVNIQQGVKLLEQSNQYYPICYLAFPQYFYLSATTIDINHSWICDRLSVIPVTTVDTPSSMVVPRNSEYAELFNFQILKMIGRGLNRRYVQLYTEVVTLKCTGTGAQIFHPLGYNDMFTAFLIVFTGGMIAAALLVLERMFSFSLKKRQEKLKKKSLTGGSGSGVSMTMDNGVMVSYGGWLF